MNFLKATLVACALGIIIAGCSTTDSSPGRGSAFITTVGMQLPEGLIPAVIFEIDGNRVWYKKHSHILTPGEHTVRVVPAPERPFSTESNIMLLAEIAANKSLPLTIVVEPGKSYRIAAREVTYRTSVQSNGEPDHSSGWKTAVIPTMLSAAVAN